MSNFYLSRSNDNVHFLENTSTWTAMLQAARFWKLSGNRSQSQSQYHEKWCPKESCMLWQMCSHLTSSWFIIPYLTSSCTTTRTLLWWSYERIWSVMGSRTRKKFQTQLYWRTIWCWKHFFATRHQRKHGALRDNRKWPLPQRRIHTWLLKKTFQANFNNVDFSNFVQCWKPI